MVEKRVRARARARVRVRARVVGRVMVRVSLARILTPKAAAASCASLRTALSAVVASFPSSTSRLAT
eukprot:scaffold116964_cov63-Phaeocystis_antarctica.AAC.2